MRIPPRRPELRLIAGEDEHAPWQLIDDALSRRVLLSEAEHSVFRALQEPTTVAALSRDSQLSPPVLRACVEKMVGHGLLQTPHARRLIDAPRPSATPDVLLPLHFAPGLRHACQGCGGCCSSGDIGPISASQAQHLLHEDWSSHLGPAAPAPLRAVPWQGQPIYLTRMEQDTCVFLDAHTRCQIHSRLGPEAKPLPCRQFPWRFTRVGERIDVSLYSECRAWRAAAEAAPDPAEQSDELRALIARQRLPALPPLIPVDEAVLVPLADYLSEEAALIQTIRAAPVNLTGALGAYEEGAAILLTRLRALPDPDEAALVSPAAWESAFPDAFPDPDASILRTRVLDDLADFAAHAARIADQRQLPWLALRFGFLGRAARADFVDPAALRTPDPVRLHALLSDLLVSAIFGKEVARAGLRSGLARLSLRARLTLHAAAARAREACRVQLTVQDLNDSCTTISKVFREQAILGLLDQLDDAIRDGFGPAR